jgi:hypothetical protein
MLFSLVIGLSAPIFTSFNLILLLDPEKSGTFRQFCDKNRGRLGPQGDTLSRGRLVLGTVSSGDGSSRGRFVQGSFRPGTLRAGTHRQGTLVHDSHTPFKIAGIMVMTDVPTQMVVTVHWAPEFTDISPDVELLPSQMNICVHWTPTNGGMLQHMESVPLLPDSVANCWALDKPGNRFRLVTNNEAVLATLGFLLHKDEPQAVRVTIITHTSYRVAKRGRARLS